MEYSGEKIYILNPMFSLRSDERRIILFNSTNDLGTLADTSQVLTILHPLYASILAMFDGKNSFAEIIGVIGTIFKLPKKKVLEIVAPLICNEKELQFEIEGTSFFLPKRMIIEKRSNHCVRNFPPKDVFIPRDNLDLTSRRLYRPLDVTFMVGTTCLTNCIYCYANRRKKNYSRFTIKKIKEVIREANDIGVRSFNLTGGEIFLYSHWQELIEELLKNNYYPYLSTKMPLDLSMIKTLKMLGINRIQISLDTIVPAELKKILHVDADYFDRLRATIKNLDRLGFEIYTNSQIMKYNFEHVKELLNFLLSIENIKRINVGSVGFSLYTKENYVDYALTQNMTHRIESIVNQVKGKAPDHVSINFSGYLESSSFFQKDQYFNFQSRAKCSGNFSSIFILPDGRVTICEQLHDLPAFILGDLVKQSIVEMWNSDEAVGLYKFSKNLIRDKSPCAHCDEFDSCHQYKGICWKLVLYAYGEENWDFPDPRCPMAPAFKKEFYIK